MSTTKYNFTRRNFIKTASAILLSGTFVNVNHSPLWAKFIKMYGPSGGKGGMPFLEDRFDEGDRIHAISIWSGKRIDALQMTIATPGGARVNLNKWGGNGGLLDVFILDADEYLESISGSWGKGGKSTDRVTSLKLKTNHRVSVLYGKNAGEPFEHSIAPGEEIVGFCGRCGDEIDSLGILVR